ncbi:MAG: hypothetical protein ACI9KE_000172 [Polyangiales bacterium]|jgi:hypothetical protein
MVFEWMPKRDVAMQHVVVPPSAFFTFKNSRAFKLNDNSLHRAFRNTDVDGNVSQSCISVARNTEKDVRVIAEESPVGFFSAHGRILPEKSMIDRTLLRAFYVMSTSHFRPCRPAQLGFGDFYV